MSEERSPIAQSARYYLRSLAMPTFTTVDNDVNASSSIGSARSVTDELKHTPPPAHALTSNNVTQPTETCTKKGRGIRNDGVCGMPLAGHEIGKNKRCSNCRAKDASDKRKSVRNIAKGCGARKHRHQSTNNVSAMAICSGFTNLIVSQQQCPQECQKKS